MIVQSLRAKILFLYAFFFLLKLTKQDPFCKIEFYILVTTFYDLSLPDSATQAIDLIGVNIDMHGGLAVIPIF